MDIRGWFGKRPSRGKHSLKSGLVWESRCSERLKQLRYRMQHIVVHSTAGATSGQDIQTTIGKQNVGWEAKNKGAFEGGGTTLYQVNGRLVVPDKCPLIKSLFGTHVPWGRVPGKGEYVDDDYIDVPEDSVSKYYIQKGTHYILVEEKGIFHTGKDVLALGVPFFSVKGMRLRTRVTKHMKHGVPTDISCALVFSRKNIPMSPYSLFGPLPLGLTQEEE